MKKDEAIVSETVEALEARAPFRFPREMVVVLAMALGLGLAATGLWLWRRPGALVPWLVHLALFTAWLPAFAGHFYLAVLNPGTRHALRAMFVGDVDLDWARHHHPRWVDATERGDEPVRAPRAREPRALAGVALPDEA
jgi:cytochrome b subunit of formate dehydrogenase